jgi:transcriptional regulator with XRE-family HTH domain
MKTQYDILMEDAEFRRLLSMETLVTGASEMIARLMAEQNVSKADLARSLNKSRAWVTQLLSGKANMTVRTLAEVAHALGAEVKLNAQPVRWKVGGKPLAESHTVVYKMDDYLVDPCIGSESVFRLQSDQLMSTEYELASVKPDDPSNTEYAA